MPAHPEKAGDQDRGQRRPARPPDPRAGQPRRPRLLFITNHVAFFASHRLPIAQEALQREFDVWLLTGQGGSPAMEDPAAALVDSAGIGRFRVNFSPAGMNPLREAWEVLRMYRIVRRLRPDLVHCASPKGVLYGGLVARLLGVPGIVLSISGLGYAFTAGGARRRVAAGVYRALVRFVLSHSNKKVVVQNRDDAHRMQALFGVGDGELELIPGSGVDLAAFGQAASAHKQQIVLFPARLLKDKGVAEFLSAASQLKPVNPDWRFVLAGAVDYQNPSALDEQSLRRWRQDGRAEVIGHQHDMVPWYAAASIVCLPSYREGMPKSLLEAAAAGCAVVTTDVAGCREAIIPSRTGDLVPPRDVPALARALQGLIDDEARRRRYGAEGQMLAARRFDITAVVRRTIELYRELLRHREMRNVGQ